MAEKTLGVGIAAAVATLVGYTTGLLYGSILRVLSTGSLFGLFFGLFLRTTVLIILSIYMGPVDPQVDHQAIQSILCCAYITTIIVIFIIGQVEGNAAEEEDYERRPGNSLYD
jgi:hypothetical protein